MVDWFAASLSVNLEGARLSQRHLIGVELDGERELLRPGYSMSMPAGRGRWDKNKA